MTHWSLSNVLFSLQLFACFLLLLLLLCSSFIALWSDRMQGFFSIFLYLLRCALWPKIRSTLEKVPWAAEKNVYYAVAGWNMMYTSLRSIWSMVSFSSRISLLIFCLDDLSIGDRMILSLSLPLCCSVYVLLSPLLHAWWSWVYWFWVNIGLWLLFPFDVLPLLLVWSVHLCLIWLQM
jgi:hypothetical protein